MWIETLRIEGGVLDGFQQEFDPHLNVLIGGRGTGKSSVIELIRFCLGAVSSTEASQTESMEHALGVLGDGRVTIVLANGRDRFEVTRTAQDETPQLSDPLAPPFVFAQSEIETIGLQARSRLRLIDDFLPPKTQTPGDRATASKIRSISAEIRTILAEMDDITEKTAELPKVQAQLASLKEQSVEQSKASKAIEQQRAALSEITAQLASARVRSEVIGRTSDRLETWVSDLENSLDQRPSLEPWPPQATSADELSEIRKKEVQANARLRAGLDELKSIAADLQNKKAASTALRSGLENRARDFRQKIEEHQKGASALDKRVSDLTQQISVLKSLVDLRKERADRVARLTDQREKILQQQDAVREALTKAREKIATRLSSDLAPSVRVRIQPYADRREYVAALASALRGSGLRYAEISDRIASTYSPQEIAKLAESRDAKVVATALQITEERASRLCDALRGQAGTALFTTVVEDDVELALMDGADYKEVDFLSMGQRCTVILPIILRHAERVIVLDQPEDHLDNAFVVGTLVKALSARSGAAQSIVATHNPNIPVIGEAQRVVHLDSDGSRCFVRSTGGVDAPTIVDAITTIMEGGRAAFAKRAEFYARNSPNVPKR